MQGGAPDGGQSVGEGRGGSTGDTAEASVGGPRRPRNLCVNCPLRHFEKHAKLGQVPFSSNPRLSAALETRPLPSLSSENPRVTACGDVSHYLPGPLCCD